MGEKYDVGILGVWYGCNYGSIATYYSLYRAVRSMGKSVLMVHRPWIEPFNEKGMERRHSMKFATKWLMQLPLAQTAFWLHGVILGRRWPA